MAFVTSTAHIGAVRAQYNTLDRPPNLNHHKQSRSNDADRRLHALDAALFRAPWVLIGEDNSSPARAATLADARAALTRSNVRAVAGRVRGGVLVADIDPIDGYPIHGDACAEALVSWCVRHGLPYLVRESGRPGGRHVISLAPSRRHRTRWRAQCDRLARQYKIDVDDRTGKTLRLLTSPHRRGRACPVITCTLTPDSLGNVDPSATTAPPAHSATLRPLRPTTPGRDTSRSAREYGLLCAMARAGYTAEAAWRAVATPGSKAAARGRRWWHRYQWLSAVTTVAAENNSTETDAWARARQACPPRYARLHRGWWRGLWRRALAETFRRRPRRRLSATPEHHPSNPYEQDPSTEITALRNALASTAATVFPTTGARRQRRDSATTVLFHLAPILVRRAGAISVRQLAERTRMDTKTVRAALALCLDTGILTRTHRYAGGATDSDAYTVGPAVAANRAGVSTRTSPTSGSTPHGRANLSRLRTLHLHERHHWRLRCTALSQLLPGERLATSTSRAAKLLRSRHYQRHWTRTHPAHRPQAASPQRPPGHSDIHTRPPQRRLTVPGTDRIHPRPRPLTTKPAPPLTISVAPPPHRCQWLSGPRSDSHIQDWIRANPVVTNRKGTETKPHGRY